MLGKVGMTGAEITFREYVERALQERDRLCCAKMNAQERAFDQALIALNKAVDKAEAAQREYNAHANEFRGQLDDQAKHLMPRTETMVLIKNLEDRIVALTLNMDARMEVLRNDISELRELRSGVEGQGTGREALWSGILSVVALLLSVVSAVGVVLAIAK